MRWPVFVRKLINHEQDKHESNIISTSYLFSGAYYRLQSGIESDTDGALHYHKTGWRCGYDPSPFFSTSYYLATYRDVMAAGMNPLLHYMRSGFRERRKPHEDFDPAQFIRMFPELVGDDEDAAKICLLRFSSYDWRSDQGRKATIVVSDTTATRRENIIQLFALLLGREPENESVIEHHLTFPTDVIVKVIVGSPEFGRRVTEPIIKGEVPYGGFFDRTPEAERLTWASQNLALSEEARSQLKESHDWIEIIRIILVDHVAPWSGALAADPNHRGFLVALEAAPTLLERIKNTYVKWLADFSDPTPSELDALEKYIGPKRRVVVCYMYKDKFSFLQFYKSLSQQELISEIKLLIVASEPYPDGSIAWGEFEAEIITIAELDSYLNNLPQEHIVIIESDVQLRPQALALSFAEHLAGSGDVLVFDGDILLDGQLEQGTFKRRFSILDEPGFDEFGFVSLSGKNRPGLSILGAHWTDPDRTAIWLRKMSRICPPVVISRLLYSRSKRERPPRRDRQNLSNFLNVSVSIIIPTRDRVDLLRDCIESIESLTNYDFSKITIFIIDNGSTDVVTLDYLERLSARTPRFLVLRVDGDFNFSRLNNLACTQAKTDMLVFLNNDTIVIDRNWLIKLTCEALNETVGFVGCKLLYPDHTVQHGGVIVGLHGGAGHVYVHESADADGPDLRNGQTRESLACTGACLAVRASVFRRIRGFDPAFEVAFNDIAACIAATRAGLRNLVIADPLLIHHESKSRGFDSDPANSSRFHRELIDFRRRYFGPLEFDPYYSPNLSLEKPGRLSCPPRRTRIPVAARDPSRQLSVLMLSQSYRRGSGIAATIERQVDDLRRQGFRVLLGGPEARGEIEHDSVDRVYLSMAQEAAEFAFRHSIDLIVAHTPPFHSVVRFIGQSPALIQYDHGEVDPTLFSTAVERSSAEDEKRLCFSFSANLACICQAIKDASGLPGMKVISPGNSQFGNEAMEIGGRQDEIKQRYGWQGKRVVLSLVGSLGPERRFNGIDAFVDLALSAIFTLGRDEVIFVLCGGLSGESVPGLAAGGLHAIAYPDEPELDGLFRAADVYVSLSRRNGYDPGIARALAQGLAVVASDIPAHRELPINIARDHSDAHDVLLKILRSPPSRTPVIYEWAPALASFRELVFTALGKVATDVIRPLGFCSTAS